MRLTPDQQRAIREVAESLLGEALLQVYLYGSRTQDNLKGGDIDLIFLVKNGQNSKLPSPYALTNELKKQPSIGDQRIDLKIITKQEIENDPFLRGLQNSFVAL